MTNNKLESVVLFLLKRNHTPIYEKKAAYIKYRFQLYSVSRNECNTGVHSVYFVFKNKGDINSYIINDNTISHE